MKTEDPSATTKTWCSQINNFFKKPTGELSVKKGSMGEGEAHRQMGTCVSSRAVLPFFPERNMDKSSSKERPTSQDHSNFHQNLFILSRF